MSLSLEFLWAGDSCFTVEEIEEGFLFHVVPGDEENFNIIVRRLLNEASEEFVAAAHRR